MIDSTDAAFMAQALRQAERGLYTTHPNPRVGSIIVKDGRIVGRGFHLQAGKGHAEANALAEAGEQARGATVYCTLEPCSFHGRTPSCAEALVGAGVARVVVAMTDPHTRNAGKGLEILRDAGIEVECPLMEASARTLNPGHIKRFETGLPFVRVKLAMSLDGKTALANGASQWITGVPARRDVQRWRARSSAIVTGVGTVADDDPSLTVREAELDVEAAGLAAAVTRPILVLDPNLRVPPTAGLLSNPDLRLVCLAAPAAGVTLDAPRLVMPDDGRGRIDLRALLAELAKMECNEVLFECGATLAGAVIEQGLADEIILYVGPSMLGADARSLLNVAKIDSMDAKMTFQIADTRRVGSDLRIILRPEFGK